MKKIYYLLLSAVIICGCIIAAGCVQEPATSPDLPPAVTLDKEHPAYSVTVSTAGMDTYSRGDIFALEFLSNPSTGYTWEVIEGNEILYSNMKIPALNRLDISLEPKPRDSETQTPAISIQSGKAAAETPTTGAPEKQLFWFQPSETGDYTITLKYLQTWEGEDSAVSTYSQTIHVVDSSEPSPDGAKTQYSFDTFSINPAAGTTVKIITSANPTTGCYWEASGNGLIIDEEYFPAKPEHDGSSGKYEWYAAAEKAGDYIFKAVCKHTGSDEVLTYFEIPLKFT